MVQKNIIKLFLVLFLVHLIKANICVNQNCYKSNIPIVMMHGINSDASSLTYLQNLIQQNFPDRFVLNIEIGDGRFTSIFTPMFEQVKLFNQQIQLHPELSEGFHLIGFSQGTLITRGYIQLYNNPPVINYISLAGPQAGQFGTPYINISTLDNLLSDIDYISPIQNYLAPGQYWKNPKLLNLYREKSIYLGQINNERNYNQTLYDNFISINKMVLVYSTNDKVIHPPESGWFGFYDTNMNIQSFNQTEIYQQDLFGLKKLDLDDKIVFYQTDFEHTDHTNEIAKEFINEKIIPWLV